MDNTEFGLIIVLVLAVLGYACFKMTSTKVVAAAAEPSNEAPTAVEETATAVETTNVVELKAARKPRAAKKKTVKKTTKKTVKKDPA